MKNLQNKPGDQTFDSEYKLNSRKDYYSLIFFDFYKESFEICKTGTTRKLSQARK